MVTKRKFKAMDWISNNWHIILIVCIFLSAFWLRSLPGRFGELQALDPFHLYRMSEYLVNNNFVLPESDILRYYPLGVNSYYFDYMVPMYLPAMVYVSLSTIGLNMHFLNFAIMWPALLGALAVVAMYFIGNEFFGRKAGLFAAFFLAVAPAFITRTSAGFFEKECIAGFFTLFSVFLFIKAFKKGSWKYGILSGLSLAVVSGAWGGARYFYLLYSGFLGLLFLLSAILLVLDHLFSDTESLSKRIEAFFGMDMLKAYLPTILLGVLIFQIFPHHTPLTSMEVVLSFAVLAVLLVRNGAERLSMVSKEKLRLVVPCMLLLGMVFLLVGSMFSDVLYGNLQQISALLGMSRDVVGTTVAENAPGDWSNVIGMIGTGFSGGALTGFLGLFNSAAPYVSLWIIMLLGLVLIAYRFYRTREWLLIFPIVWLATSIYGVFYAVRLIFLLGPPAALIGGFFMAWFVDRFFRFHRERRAKSEKPRLLGLVPALVIIVTALVVGINLANGYVYSNGLGPSVCMPREGELCLTIAENGTIQLDGQQPWYQALNFLSGTGQNNSVLSWWDFGYWFQTRGNKPSVADGGNLGGPYSDRDHRIADWFTSTTDRWDEWVPWMKNLSVGYILMDYTLPAKYGAISKIASDGEQIVGFLEFRRTGMYPQGNQTTYVFGNGPYEIWMPFDDAGMLIGTPMFLVKQNDQYQQKTYINDVCTKDGIIRTGEQTPSLEGCVAISELGVHYIPPEAEHTIFINLMFMEGRGFPLEKVFDNSLIKIYKVNYSSESALNVSLP
jgi:asparagine N-glycosylation enzyme membrane subunit Stt3